MADLRYRGNFTQSPASRRLQQDLLRTRFNPNRRNFLRPGSDLAGRRTLGRGNQNRTFANGQRIAEAVGFYAQGVMNQAVQVLYNRMVKERLSAKFSTHFQRKDGSRGRKWIKLPLSAGLRQNTRKLLNSLRVRAFTPGTTKKTFRGVYRILAQIGGPSLGEFDYAVLHEKTGRLQFMRVTNEEFDRVRAEIRAGATQIAMRAGAKVS